VSTDGIRRGGYSDSQVEHFTGKAGMLTWSLNSDNYHLATQIWVESQFPLKAI
jgi:hypothetical protein